jgi:pimeloyl-ACP methyl ester carboxylesterase
MSVVPSLHLSRRARWILTSLVLALAIGVTAGPTASAQARKPTVVLFHGAFADASSWNLVTARLQHDGYTVVAPANPLRGVASDAAYLRDVLASIPGPIVLVGHSYGGMVITNAATGNPNVKALVYIAAYAPDEGDTANGLSQLGGGGGLVGPATLDLHPFTAADGTQQQEATVKVSQFRKVFAADLPAQQSAVMAAEQRPAALSAFSEPSGPPAWKTIKSYYMVAGSDRAIGSKPELAMAKRIGAVTTIAKGSSHVPMLSQPAFTTKFIERATK